DQAPAAAGLAPDDEPAPVAPARRPRGDTKRCLPDSLLGDRQVAPARRPRADTKQAQMIEMLRRPEGVTIDEIAGATGWQRHTVRGAIAGALKKKLGLVVISENTEDRG